MPSAALTSKNQLTLPRAIREHLRVGPGDRVLFRLLAGGQVVVEPETLPVTALKGLVRSPLRRPVTLEEMDEAVARAAADRSGGRRDRG